jgi:hypothetical protein
MGLEDDFYATIKLKNGEEVFCKAAVIDEDDRSLIMLHCPIVITEYKSRTGCGYKVEPWLKTTTNDMLVIDKEDILTMCETTDLEMIKIYHQYTRQYSLNGKNPNQTTLTKEQGYIASISEAKEILEKIFDL